MTPSSRRTFFISPDDSLLALTLNLSANNNEISSACIQIIQEQLHHDQLQEQLHHFSHFFNSMSLQVCLQRFATNVQATLASLICPALKLQRGLSKAPGGMHSFVVAEVFPVQNFLSPTDQPPCSLYQQGSAPTRIPQHLPTSINRQPLLLLLCMNESQTDFFSAST